MISVRRAFNRHTTMPVMFSPPIGGHWDADNQWVVDQMQPAYYINATPIPHGDRDEGVFGSQLKANPELERVPAFMKFHSTSDMPMKSLLMVYGTTYMVTQHGNLAGAGFFMVIASKVQNLVLELGVPAPHDAVPFNAVPVPATDSTSDVAGWP